MRKVFLYSYSKCSTCIKASNWLEQNNIKHQLIDIVKETPSQNFLELALKQFSLDKKKIFNIRGKSFKSINFNIKDLSNEEIIELLSNNWMLIKRPFLVINASRLILGFKESEYSDHFK